MRLLGIIRASTPRTVKPTSILRARFERWLGGKFLVRYGPVMYRVRGEFRYVDHYGKVYRLVPTHEPDVPFAIIVEECQ